MFYIPIINHRISLCRIDHQDERWWFKSVDVGWLLVNTGSLLHHFSYWRGGFNIFSSFHSWKDHIDKYARINDDCNYSVSFYFIRCAIGNFSENYLSVSKWFKRPGFYRTCALYTLTRMIYNLTQCYIPVYVSESMNYPTKYVGYVPLVLYLAGCLYSAVVTPMVNLVGKKVKLEVILSLTFYSRFTLLLGC